MSRKSNLRGWLYVAPILLFAAAFSYYPFLRTVAYSLSDVSFTGEITAFAGLRNYAKMIADDDFLRSLFNTLALTAMFVLLNLMLSLSLALAARKRMRMLPLLELLPSLPMAVAMSSAALLFGRLLDPVTGIVNSALGLNIGWFQDKKYALFGILLLCIWMGVSLSFLLLLAALRNVPPEIEQAAALDGAGGLTILTRITLPAIAPTVRYVVCTNAVLAMMTSGPVLILTGGGPVGSTQTLVYTMYAAGYQNSNYAYASCVSVTVFLLTLTMTLTALRSGSERGWRM